MNIGEFKQSNGRLMGAIATRTIDLPRLGLRPVESSNDRAPVFEIVALNVGNRWVQVPSVVRSLGSTTSRRSGGRSSSFRRKHRSSKG